jgi:mannose-6-phosphate isomerase-like protein (cupin superfamily)
VGDYSVKTLEDMDTLFDGMVARARASLGGRAFGMQVLTLPPDWEAYPNHNHREDAFEGSEGQEEVYVTLSGSGTLRVGGEEYRLEPGVFARVGPDEKRQIVPGGDGVRVLCLGGVPGRAYEAPPWTELGAPPPSS